MYRFPSLRIQLGIFFLWYNAIRRQSPASGVPQIEAGSALR